MDLRFWKEIIITQTCSGAISLVASSVIVTFISLTGLSSPYRRLIFGLSISDICQSVAVVLGPWLSPSDVPQALWGVGNKHSCQLDGFLFLVGVTAAPMYTFSLCIYYVCKLKGKMSDESFAHRVEKKVHITIVVLNLSLYITAIAMGVINPGTMGNGCFPAAVPTGCRQNPEVYGECDPQISKLTELFSLFSFFVMPILTLIGIVWCLAVLFWHALMREKIFGRPPSVENENDGLRNTYVSRMRRHGRFSSFYSSELTSIQERNDDDDDSSAPPRDLRLDSAFGTVGDLTDDVMDQFGHHQHSNPTPQSSHRYDSSTGSTEGEESKADDQQQRCLFKISEMAANANDRAPCSIIPRDSVQAYHSQNGSDSAEIMLPPSSSSNLQVQHEPTQDHESARSLVSLSRLYKRELITQACCYVLVFFVSTMPFLILNFMLVSGAKPSPHMFRASVATFPLAGLFNIIVYTRPNVGSFRRRHPECSRLQAFWLVLKAGGEVPNDDVWSRTTAWRLCCHRRPSPSRRIMEINQDQRRALRMANNNESSRAAAPAAVATTEGPVSVNFLHQEPMSDLPVGMDTVSPSSQSPNRSSSHVSFKNGTGKSLIRKDSPPLRRNGEDVPQSVTESRTGETGTRIGTNSSPTVEVERETADDVESS